MRKVAARFTRGDLAASLERWIEHTRQKRTIKKVAQAFMNGKVLSCFLTWREAAKQEKEARWSLRLDAHRERAVRRGVRTKALPFCCASTVFLSKTVPFRAVPLSQVRQWTLAHLRGAFG
eukprot:SAG22_NODE_886_length_6665_cov_3.040359_1_plen_119_part_10